jgi:RNA polymerase sigma-70 factor (ECF subfamily)
MRDGIFATGAAHPHARRPATNLRESWGTWESTFVSNKATYGSGGLSRDEERALVERAQAGDEQALEELLAAHQDLVYRTALRFTAGREEPAFELAQEVLISAFRHIRKFRAQSRLSTWLYRITANLAKNRYVVENRERARFTSLDNPSSGENDVRPREWRDAGVGPRQQAEGNEAMEILHERLSRLEPEWREVIVLRYFEDLSYEEIAEVLDVPLGTVKSRINRARRMLRELMEDVMEEGHA